VFASSNAFNIPAWLQHLLTPCHQPSPAYLFSPIMGRGFGRGAGAAAAFGGRFGHAEDSARGRVADVTPCATFNLPVWREMGKMTSYACDTARDGDPARHTCVAAHLPGGQVIDVAGGTHTQGGVDGAAHLTRAGGHRYRTSLNAYASCASRTARDIALLEGYVLPPSAGSSRTYLFSRVCRAWHFCRHLWCGRSISPSCRHQAT